MEFTILKSRAMTLSRSPQCRALSRLVIDEKSLSPLFPVNDWCAYQTDKFHNSVKTLCKCSVYFALQSKENICDLIYHLNMKLGLNANLFNNLWYAEVQTYVFKLKTIKTL